MRILILYIFFSFSFLFTEKRGELLSKRPLNTALLDDLNNQSSSLSIDSLVYKFKTTIKCHLFANYAPVINNFGYDTAISNGQNGSAVVSFSQRIFGKSQKTISLLPSPY
jgi:hypothetical protein